MMKVTNVPPTRVSLSDLDEDVAPVGEHVCAIYHDSEEHKVMISRFFMEGVRKKDRMVYGYSVHTKEEVIEKLRDHIDVDKLMQTGQLTLLPTRSIYFNDSGQFDSYASIAKVSEELARARQDGYERLRVIGEMEFGCLCKDPLLEYEYELFHLFEYAQIVGMCMYRAHDWASEDLLKCMSCHPKVIIGHDEFDNFYYVPPIGPNKQCGREDRQLRHWVKNLLRRKHTERKLRERTDELTRLNRVLEAELDEKRKIQSAKEAAEALSNAKSQFLAVVSHEIRTPLNGIVCMTGFLADTEVTPSQREYINAIGVSSEHLMTVLNDILDFSKLEAQKLVLDFSPASVRVLVEGVAKLLREGTDKHITITHYVDPAMPKCLTVDVTRLRQILLNLVNNSVKFTPATGGVVEIHATLTNRASSTLRPEDSRKRSRESSADYEILFSVKDNGIGIPPEKHNVIFSAFSQVDSSTTRKYGGTGLGLSICKHLVDMMGGRIWYESEDGKGTTFYFTVKAAAVPCDGDEPHEKMMRKDAGLSELSRSSFHSLRTLIVEDNAINQRVMQQICYKLGISAIEIVGNGKEAVEAVAKSVYDLVFMDLQMPVMGGLEAANIISNMDWSSRPRPHLIAMTASTAERDKRECKEAGMYHHLPKPIRIGQVGEILSHIVTNAPLSVVSKH